MLDVYYDTREERALYSEVGSLLPKACTENVARKFTLLHSVHYIFSDYARMTIFCSFKVWNMFHIFCRQTSMVIFRDSWKKSIVDYTRGRSSLPLVILAVALLQRHTASSERNRSVRYLVT